jgi:cephalosporin hydroxylase
MRLGDYFPERPSPPLTAEQSQLVDQFHDFYYSHWLLRGADTLFLSWLGYETCKCPLDLWIYQELLVKTRPDFVVETGTYRGGSALYLATILDLIGHGHVITIDIEAPGLDFPQHSRLSYVTGSSIDPRVVEEVQRRVGSARAMVILDSDHGREHVFNELVAYSPLVHPGDYLIVEDTDINGHPTYKDFGPGPMEAVESFLASCDDFVTDSTCERFLLTMNPKGYLRRKSPEADR